MRVITILLRMAISSNVCSFSTSLNNLLPSSGIEVWRGEGGEGRKGGREGGRERLCMVLSISQYVYIPV